MSYFRSDNCDDVPSCFRTACVRLFTTVMAQRKLSKVAPSWPSNRRFTIIFRARASDNAIWRQDLLGGGNVKKIGVEAGLEDLGGGGKPGQRRGVHASRADGSACVIRGTVTTPEVSVLHGEWAFGLGSCDMET